MDLQIIKTSSANVEALRSLFLAEISFQFIYHKCHAAGWADTYLFMLNGSAIGYGALWGKDQRAHRDTVFEFYLQKPYRKHADIIFGAFIQVSKASLINCQSNDPFLRELFLEHAKNIEAEAILFEDCFETTFDIPDTRFRKIEADNNESNYVLEHRKIVVASGGYVWNYNFPFIDIYYEVNEDYRKRGFGTLLAQELKKEAYRLNRIPAARCNIQNKASKATLKRAGMRVCGHILLGKLEEAL